MPPRVMFQKEEIVNAALQVARRKGIDAVTARMVGAELNVSPGPIFTWFESMEELKAEVYAAARDYYRGYLERGLADPVPFRGLGRQYLRFAREEPELYKLLFLSRPESVSGGAMEAMRFSQDLARESLMRVYHMDARTADCYFRDLWLVAFGFATLIVTDDSPYTDEEMSAVLSEISLSVCKAFKEIPGLPEGKADRDALFRTLLTAQARQPRDTDEKGSFGNDTEKGKEEIVC